MIHPYSLDCSCEACVKAFRVEVPILKEFMYELRRAEELHPNTSNIPHGVGGSGRVTYTKIAQASCDRAHKEGRLTHTHVHEEESAESYSAKTRKELRKELVQVGAMTLKWISAIDREVEAGANPEEELW